VIWHEDPGNSDLLARVRALIDDGGRLFIFLGAGVSFGAARYRGRARFDDERYKRWPPPEIPHGYGPSDDDGLPMPSWPQCHVA
jgi:hypothetical protein